MRVTWLILACIGGLAATPGAGADTVRLRDGSRHDGVILGQDAREVRLEVSRGGMKIVLSFDQGEVADVVFAPESLVPAASQPAPAPAPVLAAAPPPPTVAAPRAIMKAPEISPDDLLYYTHSVAARGLPDAAHLPALQRELWTRASTLDTGGGTNQAALWEVLHALAGAARLMPGGMERLDAVCQQERHQPLAQWVARAHWDILSARYQDGVFDTSDLGDAEKPFLIGILKEQTAGALQPIEQFFPPVNPQNGVRLAYGPAQLAAITPANAIEVKDKAVFAAAVLQTQLKLEPEMPAADKQVLGGQLVLVNRVLSRAKSQEGAARALQKRAELQQRLEEERSRRLNGQQSAPGR